MYCVKCRKKTGNTYLKTQTARNKRRMLTSSCTKCKGKKCQFCSEETFRKMSKKNY